jgi:ankyrin repeat protein
MTITRGAFMKLAAASAGLGLGGLDGRGLGGRGLGLPPVEEPALAASTPEGATMGAAAELDSQRFRAAAAAGDAPAVEALLLRDPALAYSRDERGRSTLAVAAIEGRREIAALLAARIAAPDLVEAALTGNAERVKWWLQRAPALIDEPDATGFNAVHAAALAGEPALLMTMTVQGAGFNLLSVDPPRRTALRLAVEAADPEVATEMADLMLGNGADTEAPQGDGLSPLHAAAAAGRSEIVRLLIWCGADPERRTPDGETALALAERHRQDGAAALLRAAAGLPRAHRTSRFRFLSAAGSGGAPGEAPPEPRLPRAAINEYVAVSHGSLPRMRELLALYPSILLANASWNELAVEAAAHTGFKDGVRLQLDRGAPCALPTAAMMGMAARVRALLDEDPLRVHDCGAHNMPLAWFPAIGGDAPEQLEIAALLFDRGVEVDAHKRGQTALHWAARGGHAAMAELLLAHGANANARAWLATASRESTTPLALALRGGHQEVAALLRRQGAVA